MQVMATCPEMCGGFCWFFILVTLCKFNWMYCFVNVVYHCIVAKHGIYAVDIESQQTNTINLSDESLPQFGPDGDLQSKVP